MVNTASFERLTNQLAERRENGIELLKHVETLFVHALNAVLTQ